MEPVLPPKKPSPKKIASLLLKIGITVFCFWYISLKIDFERSWKALWQANWWWLLLALALYALSKLISAYRLNIYFRNIGLHLPEWENIKLYWLGMFYNLFLPGAISGDAYKVVILNRAFRTPIKKTSAAVLLDRFSGLLALGLLLSLYALMVLDNPIWNAILIGGAILSVAGLYAAINFFFKDFRTGFAATFLIGLAVQSVQVIAVYAILKSMAITVSQPEWIFIFLVSSAVSVLPISLGGGLGTRELVFAEGARFFHLQPELGVVISLLFYLTNLISSAWGGYYIFRHPLRQISAGARPAASH